jgi:hypothetical protein
MCPHAHLRGNGGACDRSGTWHAFDATAAPITSYTRRRIYADDPRAHRMTRHSAALSKSTEAVDRHKKFPSYAAQVR